MIHFPFDFPMEEPSIWTALYCLVLYLVLLFSNYRTGLSKLYYSYPTEKKEKLSVVFIGFFCITACLNGDFFHFMEFVHNYVYVGGFHNYGEPVYQAIGYFVSNNYLLFRTIVYRILPYCGENGCLKVCGCNTLVFFLFDHILLWSSNGFNGCLFPWPVIFMLSSTA